MDEIEVTLTDKSHEGLYSVRVADLVRPDAAPSDRLTLVARWRFDVEEVSDAGHSDDVGQAAALG